MIKILMGQNNQKSGESPKSNVKGLATNVASEPVIAKTIKMVISCLLELIPHRSFSFFI